MLGPDRQNDSSHSYRHEGAQPETQAVQRGVIRNLGRKGCKCTRKHMKSSSASRQQNCVRHGLQLPSVTALACDAK